MATSVGELYLQLGIDPTAYNKQLEQMRVQALATAKELERQFAGSAGRNVRFRPLKPTVDHSELNKLNRHLDLKQKHWSEVKRDFAKPIVPKVDFKQLDQLEQRLKRIRSGGSIDIGFSGSTSGGSRSSNRSEFKQLAELIGREVSRANRQGGGISGAIGRIATMPIKVAGQSAAKVAEGLVYGVTEEVTRNLGKGLSAALEESVSGMFGSTELIGKKLGSTIGGSVVSSYSETLGGIKKALQDVIEQIPSEQIQERLTQKLRRGIRSLEQAPSRARSNLVEMIGEDNARSEGLYQRGVASRSQRRRTPIMQEQSVQEWRQALADRDRIQGMASSRLQRNQQRRADITPQIQAASEELKKLQTELLDAEFFGASNETVSALKQQVASAKSNLAELSKTLKDINDQESLAQQAVSASQSRVKITYQQVRELQPESQPRAYEDIARSVVGSIDSDRIPRLRIADASLKKAGAISQYDPARNAIEVTREMYEAIKSGTLTERQIYTLREELEHAKDFDFGSFQGIQAARNNRIIGKPVQYSQEEFEAIAAELGAYSPERRALELNAKVKARRGMPESMAAQRQQFLLNNVPTLAANRAAVGAQGEQFSGLLSQYERLARQAGNDVSKAVTVYRSAFKQIADQISNLANEVVRDSASLDESGIAQIAKKIEQYWQGITDLDDRVRKSSAAQIDEIVRLGRHDQGMGGAYSPIGVESRTVEREFLDPKQDVWNIKPSVRGQIERFGAQAGGRLEQLRQGAAPALQAIRQAGGRLAYGAGVAAGGLYSAGVDALASPQTAALASTFSSKLKDSGTALARVAVAGYRLAEGMESITLAVMPYGAQLKGLAQHVALPAAAFGVATHILPGGAQAGQFLLEGAQTAIAPLTQGAGNALGAQASELIAGGLPHAFGIQSAVSSAVSGAMESVVSGAGTILAQAGAVLLGGKAVQSAAALPPQMVGRMVSKRAGSAPALPAANIPLSLPSADKEMVLVEQQAQQLTRKQKREAIREYKRQQDAANRAAVKQVAQQAGQAAGEMAGNIQSVVESTKAEAQKLNKAFSNLYQGLKQAVKEGNDALVRAYGQELKDLEASSLQKINSLIEDAKQQGNLKLLGELGGVKGQMSRRQKLANKALKQYQGTTIDVDVESGEDLKAQQMLEFSRRGLNSNRASNPAEAEELEKVRKLLDEAIKAADRFDVAMRQAMSSADDAYERSSESLNQYLEAMETGDFSKITTPMQRLGEVVKLVVTGLLGFQALTIVLPILQSLGRESLAAASALEELETRFRANLGSSGGDALQTATENAVRFRQDIGLAREAYIDLAAAVKGTPLEFAVEDLSTALAAVSRQQGLGAQQQERAQRALIQMAGKGRLYSEEVFGQLAEAIPSAPGMIARSMGTDVAGLRAQMKSGLDAQKVIPGLIQQMQVEASMGQDAALNTTASSVQNLNNQVLLLQETVGQGLLPIQKLGVDALAGILEAITPMLDELVTLAGVAMVAALLKLTMALMSVNTAMAALIKGGGLMASGMVNATKAIVAFATSSANSFSGLLIGITGVIELFKLFKTVAADAGGEARQFVTEMDAMLAKSGQVADGQKQDMQASALENFLPFQMLPYGREIARGIEGGTQRFLGLTTLDEKQANDLKIAENEAIQRSDQAMQRVIDVLNTVNAPGSAVGQLRANQQRMRDLQDQRTLMPSSDRVGREKIDAEIRQLMQSNRAPEAEVRAALAVNAKSIEGLRRLRDEATDPATYERYARQLEQATALQDKLNQAIANTVVTVERLEAAMARIDGTLQESNRAIDKFGNETREAIANGNFTEGQRQFQQSISQQELLAERIAATQRAYAELSAQLNDPETQRILTMAGFNNQSSPAAIRERIASMPEGDARSRLTVAADQIERMSEYDLQVSDLRAQMAETAQQARESLRNSAQEINDFFRSISRNAEQMALETEANQLQAAAIRAKTALQRSLTGLRSRFFGGFIDGVTEIFDLLAEQEQRAIQAKQQIQQIQFGQQDQALQAAQLQRGVFGGGGGATVPFQGVHVTSAVDASGEPGLDYVVSDGKRGAPIGSLMAGQVIEVVNDQNWESHLEAGDTRRGYGNRVIIRAIDELGNMFDMLYAHLDQVNVQVGQQVGVGSVIGTQGRTGSTTGAHVSVDFFGPDSNSATAASLAARDRIARTLATNPGALNSQIQAAPQPQQQAANQALNNIASIFAGGSSSIVARAIGVSEGTRTPDGGFTSAFGGHTDPGNGVRNIGSFSYQAHQGGASTPEEADALWLRRLESQQATFAQRATAAGLDPNNSSLLLNFLDLYTQSPAAATSRGGFLDQLPQIAREGATEEAILNARLRSYYNPDTGSLDAPGFGNDPNRLRADQQRRMQALAQVAQGAGIGMGGTVPGGAAPANIGLINQGLTIGSQASSAAIASIQELTAAENEASQLRAQQLTKQLQQDLVRGTEELQDTVLTARRRQEDALASLLPSGAYAQYISETTQLQRDFEDNTRELSRTIRDGENDLQNLIALREQFANIPTMASLIPGLDTAIAETEEQLEMIKSVFNGEEAIYQQRREMLERQYRQPMEDERMLSQRATENLRQSAVLGNIRDPGLQAIAQSGLQMEQIRQNYGDQIRPLSRDIELLERQLQSFADQGISMDSTQVVAATERLDHLRAQVTDLQDQQDIELGIVIRERNDAMQQYSRDIEGQVIEGQASLMEASGNTIGAAQVREQAAIASEQVRYNDQIASLNQLAATGIYSNQAIADLRHNLEALHTLNLQSIDQQFQDLGETMGQLGKDAFGSFLTDILQGKDALESLQNALSNLAGQLAQMAVNHLFADIFGGGPAAAPASGGGGLLGGILGAVTGGGGGGLDSTFGFIDNLMGGGPLSIFGFNAGGVVPDGDFSAYRQGDDPIARALRKEGNRAVLAALTPGERVLTAKENERFERLGLINEVRNFKSGGRVGVGATVPAIAGGLGGINVSVDAPIHIENKGGGDMDPDSMERLRHTMRQEMRKTAADVVAKEQRPGGSLDRSGRRR